MTTTTRKIKLPFQLSVETDGGTERGVYHLGTDESVARFIISDMFKARKSMGMSVKTIALMDSSYRMVDCYDGEGWASDQGFAEG